MRFTSRLTPSLKNDIAAAILEFIGTTFFLLFGLGGIQATTGEDSVSKVATGNIDRIFYISTAMGMSLLVSAWLFFRVTGGLFNPNISLSLLLVGIIGPTRFVLYCIAQLLGAIAASYLLLGLTSSHNLSVNTGLQQGISPAQGVFIEMFITAALVLSVLMLAAEKHQATPFAPVGIGLTLYSCHLFAVYYTGAAMNTARAFGPAVASGFSVPNHWVYWIGPFLGSLLASGFYATIKHYRYWLLNPDQASVDTRKSPEDPVEAAIAAIERQPGASSASLTVNGDADSSSSASRKLARASSVSMNIPPGDSFV
ncbi:aquaporin-like protein [Pluteus cervinus]|uniref:Aquaporin-like protein n=1 Tax=Pluteus cervinus TaxID=181527 RepID=A0ACD3B5F0_9AGAR|nr:aquaporin-like protein [Pluteus cervinus]